VVRGQASDEQIETMLDLRALLYQDMRPGASQRQDQGTSRVSQWPRHLVQS
jgi:hypothetical protein